MLKGRRKKLFEQQKREHLLRWFASFFVSSAAVVTLVVVAQEQPNQPVIRFNNVMLHGEMIFYETVVEDPDNTLVPETLILDVKSGLEMISIPLEPTSSFGEFFIRFPELEYRLAIKGSQGFGLKTFDSVTVFGEGHYSQDPISEPPISDSEPPVSDSEPPISDSEPPVSDSEPPISEPPISEDLTPSAQIYGFDYTWNDRMIDVRGIVQYTNPGNDYSEFTLHRSCTAHDPSSGDPVTYNFNPQLLTEEITNFSMPNIDTMDLESFIFEVTAVKDGVTEVLTRVMKNPPIKVEGSINVDSFTNTSLAFRVNFFGYASEVVARVNLYEGTTLAHSELVPYDVNDQSQERLSNVSFTGLKEDTTYDFELVIEYTDLFREGKHTTTTEREQVKTAYHYEITPSHTIMTESFFYNLDVYDPGLSLSNLKFNLYNLDPDTGSRTLIEEGILEPIPGSNEPGRESYERNHVFAGTEINFVEITATLSSGNRRVDIVIYSFTIN